VDLTLFAHNTPHPHTKHQQRHSNNGSTHQILYPLCLVGPVNQLSPGTSTGIAHQIRLKAIGPGLQPVLECQVPFVPLSLWYVLFDSVQALVAQQPTQPVAFCISSMLPCRSLVLCKPIVTV
jgi:hypothetical protein